jgi:hypothetical protein
LSAEKYILGELSAPECDQFEDHFFNCAKCAQDVRDLTQLMAGSRQVLRTPEPDPAVERVTPRRAGWADRVKNLWFSPGYAWCVSCGLLVVTMLSTVQTISLRRQISPAALTSYMLRPETRGEITSIPAQNLGQFLLMEADVPGASGGLRWELRASGSDDIVADGSAGAPDAGASFKLLLPASKLAAAEYKLTIRSTASQPEKQWFYRFTIR